MMIHRVGWILALVCIAGPFVARAAAQAQVTGWGNLRGMGVDDQLVPFTTSVGIYSPDFSQLTRSQREGPTHTSSYVRAGNAVSVGISLRHGTRAGGRRPETSTSRPIAATTGTIDYTVTYTNSAPGVCDVHIHLSSATTQEIGGVYFFVTLSASEFPGTIPSITRVSDATTAPAVPDANGTSRADGAGQIRLEANNRRSVEITFPSALNLVLQRNQGRDRDELEVIIPIVVGNLTAGQAIDSAFTIKAAGVADTSPVTVTLYPAKAGRTFDGIGGNYRIQNQRLDPLHSQYIFDHMRVAYGRVAMPWDAWQPRADAPPPLLANAATQPTTGAGRRGGGNRPVQTAMEMAQVLAKKNIPMIISCWSPPQWAVLPNSNGRGGGQRLDPAKWDAICQSIGDYLLYLRDHYGAEPMYFSFNESNIGINVLQSPQEHDEAIKRLGAHFKAIGVKTLMLLGDTGDVPPINFIQPALNDPEAISFIGAISFHSWRGATDPQYQRWADAAAKLNVPLIDAEGGNDAQAYSYSNLFREEWYALDEATEYVRLMRICQPKAILEWQFTENYSVLHADASGALQPTQRFFNLKQINLTPAGSAWISAQSSSALVPAAALLEQASGVVSIHLVNTGAVRPLTLNGLPTNISQVAMYVTDAKRGVEKIGTFPVTGGSAQLSLPARALVTLISDH